MSRNISKIVNVVNFASPRVGNKNFKKKCNEKQNLCIYRITNDRDIVTAVPMVNFEHVGTNILVSNNKIKLFYDNKYPWWTYSLFNCWKTSDHDVDLYYSRVKKHKWN